MADNTKLRHRSVTLSPGSSVGPGKTLEKSLNRNETLAPCVFVKSVR